MKIKGLGVAALRPGLSGVPCFAPAAPPCKSLTQEKDNQVAEWPEREE
jgi:hypothetical protein